MIRAKNEKELHQMGLMVDPNDPTQAVPLKKPDEDIPNERWSLEKLAGFAGNGFGEAKRLQGEATALARKSTVQIFWAGCALSLAKPKVKAEGKGWRKWLSERGIPRTNAWEAEELYKQAKKVEAVADLTLTEAKRKFGVTKPPKTGKAKGQPRLGVVRPSNGKAGKTKGDDIPSSPPDLKVVSPDDGDQAPPKSSQPKADLVVPTDDTIQPKEHTALKAYVDACGSWPRAIEVFAYVRLLKKSEPKIHIDAPDDEFVEVQ